MPTDPWSSSRYPSANDAPNAPAQLQNAVFDLGSKTIPRFATQAARNSAATALANAGVPLADGMMCWTEDGGLYVRANGQWDLLHPETPPHMSVYRSTAQPIINADWVTVVWNAEGYDTGNNHTATGSTFGCTISGFYRINAMVGFDNNAAGIRVIRVMVDGVEALGSGNVNTTQQSIFPSAVTTLSRRYYLTAGQGVSIQVWQNSGGTLNTTFGSGTFAPVFQVTWDGPA